MTTAPRVPPACGRSCLLPVALALSWVACSTAAQAQPTPPSAETAAPATVLTAPQAVPPTEPGGSADVAKGLSRVRVVGPYVDMRSGPGRGFPAFYAAEREEWLLIELRHTDWFKVRTSRGVAGWVSREQMRATVTEDGVPFELADPTLQDYLNRRFDVGVGYGATARTSLVRLWGGWRFADTLSLDLNLASAQRQTSTTGIWTLSLLHEPWSDRRLSPFVGVGVGRFDYQPNQSLVNDEPIAGNLGVLTLGARYQLSGRMALRVDYSRYSFSISQTESRGIQAGTVGISVHF